MSSDPHLSPDQPRATWSAGSPPRASEPSPARPHTHKSAPPGPPSGAPSTPAKPARSAVRFTKTAAAWWGLIVGILMLIVLLIFIGQNTDPVDIRFLGWTWHAPKGIVFLVAAISGAAITILTGAARMIQLRLAAKRNLKKGTPG